ncbi:MAG: energy transducer TonB [Saprospiraceae bacterium]|nr:energy transducer TonB [Saprospiraceae bacterium]
MRFLFISILYVSFSPLSSAQQVGYDIRSTYQRPVLKENIASAKSLLDINPGHPSSWIEKYISVQVSTTTDGVTSVSEGTTEILNEKQKSLLQNAVIGTEVRFSIKYYPKNYGHAKDFKEIKYGLTLVPKFEAQFPGGEQARIQYLKENAIDKIPVDQFNKIELASITFIVDKDGRVSDIQMGDSSGNKEIDKILHEAIQNMPTWIPAKSRNGKTVEQEFELNVGSMIGC